MATLPRALAPLRLPHYRCSRRRSCCRCSGRASGWSRWSGRSSRSAAARPRSRSSPRRRRRDAADHAARRRARRPDLAAAHPVRGEVVRAASVGLVAMLSLTGGSTPGSSRSSRSSAASMAGLYYPAYSALLPRCCPRTSCSPRTASRAWPGRSSCRRAARRSRARSSRSLARRRARRDRRGSLSRPRRLVPDCRCRPTPVRRDRDGGTRHPAVALLVDVREGFVYMVRTPWLLATLMFASLLIFLIMGPFEVLVPFVIKDVGGGPADHAISWRRSASAARSARWSSLRSGCRGATSP